MIACGSVRDIRGSIPRCCLCGRACPGGTAIGGGGDWGFSHRREAAVRMSRGPETVRNSICTEYAPGIPDPRSVGVELVVTIGWCVGVFARDENQLRSHNAPVIRGHGKGTRKNAACGGGGQHPPAAVGPGAGLGRRLGNMWAREMF